MTTTPSPAFQHRLAAGLDRRWSEEVRVLRPAFARCAFPCDGGHDCCRPPPSPPRRFPPSPCSKTCPKCTPGGVRPRGSSTCGSGPILKTPASPRSARALRRPPTSRRRDLPPGRVPTGGAPCAVPCSSQPGAHCRGGHELSRGPAGRSFGGGRRRHVPPGSCRAHGDRAAVRSLGPSRPLGGHRIEQGRPPFGTGALAGGSGAASLAPAPSLADAGRRQASGLSLRLSAL